MKKSIYKIIVLYLFVICALSGCSNFFNGSSIKNELEEKIAYAKETQITFEMRIDNLAQGSIYPATATVIKGESFEVTVTQPNPDEYYKWVIYDENLKVIPSENLNVKVISSEIDESGNKINKVKISINTNKYTKIILKPVFNLVPPKLNDVKVYRNASGDEISYAAPETWEENVRTVEYYNDPEITELTFFYTKYYKYKDTPYYQNLVKELYLDLSAEKTDMDIDYVKVELERIRDKDNTEIKSSKSDVVKICHENFSLNNKKNFTINKVPVHFESIDDGMFKVIVSVVDCAGIESEDKKVFWVIKHTPNQGKFSLNCGTCESFNSPQDVYDYCLRKQDENGYEYLVGSVKEIYDNNYFTRIVCYDNFYSIGIDNLSIPLEINITYYDEGDTDKKTFLNYESFGANLSININNQMDYITEIQKPKFEDLDENPLKYNIIKRNPQKNTYLEVNATSDYGFDFTKKLTIPRSTPSYDYFTISDNSLNFKYYAHNKKTNSQKEDKYMFIYEDITNRENKSYLFEETGHPTLSPGRTYKVYIFKKTSDFYQSGGFIPILSTTSFEFKYNGNNNWSSINSELTMNDSDWPVLNSSSFEIESNPIKNSTYVNVHSKNPQKDGIIYEYTFTYSYRDAQTYKDPATMTIVTQGPDLKLPSEFKHQLITITAKDNNGGFIASKDYSKQNIYIDLTSVDVTPPVIDIDELSFEIGGPNILYIKESTPLLADYGNNYGFSNGLRTDSNGKVEVHYWIKENSSTISDEDLKNLTEYVAYYDYPSANYYTKYHCIPIDGANTGTNSILLRFYDNNNNYADKIIVNDSTKNKNFGLFYYNDGQWAISGTKPYFFMKYDNSNNSHTYYYYPEDIMDNKVSNSHNIFEGLNGYEISTSAPALVQVFCSKTNMKKDPDLWSLRGMEVFLKQITTNYTVETEKLKIPDNHYWCIVVHYADGSKIMTPVYYKTKSK